MASAPGAVPPAGSRGRAPGQGARGAKPPEAEGILLPKRANLRSGDQKRTGTAFRCVPVRNEPWTAKNTKHAQEARTCCQDVADMIGCC